MNNLLRTLTESRVQSLLPNTDLKLLLTTVKDGRRQNADTKLSDPFYDSLEGLLHDLRTVTIDNHDAEAFLKPVSRAEVPDYYDVIANPMDLQTIMKKIKQKQYKSKREFQDDLDLIWSNCLSYNAAENHPLRPCAKRLKIKADKLLQSITDRRDRAEPPILSYLPSNGNPKVNGVVNGSTRRLPIRSTSPNDAQSPIAPPSKAQRPVASVIVRKPAPARGATFADSSAILRTPSGMATFSTLDSELQGDLLDDSQLSQTLRELLPAHLEPIDYYSGDEPSSSNANTGDKRKLNGANHPPRKRIRLEPHSELPQDEDVCNLWWRAVQSDDLIGNGLPPIPHSSSSSSSKHKAFNTPSKPNTSGHSWVRRKRRRKVTTPPVALPPKSLLALMNTNLHTMRRVRRTHSKYAALSLASNANREPGDDGETTGVDPPPYVPVPPEIEDDAGGIGLVDDNIDERPWRVKGSGIQIGEKHAQDCLKWANGKILEHAGFQGTSSMALDVLVGVTSEYFLNVGRTIKFLSEKHGHNMTSEEIILHTLFESGSSKIQDLERYISDDVERYGTRLGDLEKKIVSAFTEATAVDAIGDEDLFEQNEEDDSAFLMGNFADSIGDDFLGLRELGIAAEFGMSSLTIPKRLLKGKRGDGRPSAEKKGEPSLPYPLPPPFVPLTSEKVEDQIGLLKPYYQSRLSAVIAPAPVTAATMAENGTILPVTPPMDTILPDDAPIPTHAKLGPLGQVLKSAQASAAKKNKSNKNGPNVGVVGVGTAGAMTPGGVVDGDSKKKKKQGAVGVGTGNGGKKKRMLMEQAQQQREGEGDAGGSGEPVFAFPPIVAASA